MVVLVVQVGLARLSQVHLPAGQGPPWAQAHWRDAPDADAGPERAIDLVGYLLLVAGPVAMVFRRRSRVLGFLGVFGADGVYFAIGYPAGPAFVSLIVTFFVAVLNGPRLLAWLLCPVSYTLAVWSDPIFGRGAGPGAGEGIVPFAWPLAVLILGEVVRLTRDRIQQNQEARAEAERRRHEETRRRASEERLRIAQELHDVLAHNISMINVQASTALHLLEDQPERARPSLAAIKDASKEALVELRSALDVLRQSGERAPRAPTTGLDRLEELVERTRSTGLTVELVVDGARRTPPPGVDLAAFRIVQEALTNVVRHARARNVTVRVGYRPDGLTVEVTDDGIGPSAAADGAGNGIVGMRERAAALGGELAAGPRPGGGFRVHADLPFTDGRGPA